MTDSSRINNWRYALETVSIALLYYVLARVGQTAAIPPGNVTPVWPPAGLALAAFLLFGNRAWLGTFIGAYLGNSSILDFASASTILRTFSAGTVIAVGSFLQPLWGRLLIARYIGGPPLETVSAFLRFCAIVPVMCLVSASFGSTSLCVSGVVPLEAWGELWLTWWLGDAVGVFVATPLLLAWLRDRTLTDSGIRSVEIVLLLAAIVTSSLIAFTTTFGTATQGYPLVFLPLPFLLWSALRLGTPGATASIVVVETIAIAGTLAKQSSFVVASSNHSLLLLQLFIFVITLTTVLLSIFVEQNRRGERALQEAHRSLEERVRLRTAELSDATRMAEEAAKSEKARSDELLRLTEASQARATQESSLAGMTSQLQGKLTEEEVADTALAAIAEFIGAPSGALYVLDGDNLLQRVAAHALSPDAESLTSFAFGSGSVGQAARSRQLSVQTPPPETSSITFGFATATPCQIVTSPLVSNDELAGVVELLLLDAITEEQIRWLGKACEIAATSLRFAHESRSRVKADREGTMVSSIKTGKES